MNSNALTLVLIVAALALLFAGGRGGLVAIVLPLSLFASWLIEHRRRKTAA
jgi:hypothetical protein